MLAETRRWQVVGEAADGVRAIHSARSCQPDVILLDVELSALNGIETAKRILAGEPHSKIVFMSAHQSWDIAEIALTSGARAYMLKSAAGHELLPALDAVAGGARFISGVLVGRHPERNRPKRGVALPPSHEAVFCPDYGCQLDAFARFAEGALSGGRTVMVATASARRNEFQRRLRARGIDVDLANRQARYFPLDVSELLSAILVDGQPDERRFWNAGISLLARAARASKGECARVAICGEGCGMLAAEGRIDAAVRLEHLWHEFASTFNVEILCSYLAPATDDDEHDVRRITAGHSAVSRYDAHVHG
jgi:CheY-like chemotaxis protein